MTSSIWLRSIWAGQRPGSGHDREPDRRTQRADQHVLDLADQPLQVDGQRLKDLLAREGEQSPGQGGRAVAGVERALQQRPHLLVGHEIAHEVDIAEDGGQKIVEIVRYPAGELADALHLLALQELRLCVSRAP